MAAKRKQRVEEVVPAAKRTIESLRDIGYQLPQAVADLVDNSVSARASRINVDLHFDGTDSWIRIADNGKGMDSAMLTEALRYGSIRGYEDDDLGKFGFGLKTASTSQCRRVVVASRRSEERARVAVRALDLGHIEQTNRWEILVVDPEDRPAPLVEPLQGTSGTVVLWQNLDRVLNYKDPWGGWAKKKMVEHAESIAEHLAMVFHRFLDGTVRGKKLKIIVNGSAVRPWDPFCTSEKETIALPEYDFQVSTSSGSGLVRVSPFVLPSQSDFSDQAVWQRASGPLKWNRQQGFYIYRANRLIQWGGWSGIRTIDEHSKLARVALDFTPDLDAAFSINISKASVKLPLDLREGLEPIVSQAAGLANKRYRSSSGGTAPPKPPKKGVTAKPGAGAEGGYVPGGQQGGFVATDAGGLDTTTIDPEAPDLGTAIDEAARDTGEERALKRIKKRLRQSAPQAAEELGW